MTGPASCGARTTSGHACANPVGAAGRCAAGHAASRIPPAGAPRPGLLQADLAERGGPSGFGHDIAPEAELASATADEHYAGGMTTGVGHLRLATRPDEMYRHTPQGLPLGATYAGPIAHIDGGRAHDVYGIGRPVRDDTSRDGRRARKQTANVLRERFGHEPDITHLEAVGDGSHRATVKVGAVTMNATVTREGRWPRRRTTVTVDPQMLVGERTEVTATSVARGGNDLGPVVQSAALAQGVQGLDVNGRPLPPQVAAKFDRLERTHHAGYTTWPTAVQPRTRAERAAWASGSA